MTEVCFIVNHLVYLFTISDLEDHFCLTYACTVFSVQRSFHLLLVSKMTALLCKLDRLAQSIFVGASCMCFYFYVLIVLVCMSVDYTCSYKLMLFKA